MGNVNVIMSEDHITVIAAVLSYQIHDGKAVVLALASGSTGN
jgi:hypothetical protein